MSTWSKEALSFVTEKYFALNESWVKARRAYMKQYKVKNKKDAAWRWVILKAVKNFREMGCVFRKKRVRKRTVRIPKKIKLMLGFGPNTENYHRRLI